MAVGILDGMEGVSKGLVELCGHVTFGASGAISSSDTPGFTVSDTATGRWTITFDHKWNDMMGFSVCLDTQGTPADLQPQIYTDYSSSAGTLVFSLLAAATETDPASGDKLYIRCLMKKTNLL